jgi:hypothetical protein
MLNELKGKGRLAGLALLDLQRNALHAGRCMRDRRFFPGESLQSL